jgi:hypothetical protein
MKPRHLLAAILSAVAVYPLSIGPIALYDQDRGTQLSNSWFYKPLDWVCEKTGCNVILFRYCQFWTGD